ncbi:SAM-dependent methyltransferase [Nocardioides sp. zg-1228]|uniref:class I SAM-dependent methyltransferase n=1 Tax=Nocardioides sp. zg-1228 TaxID=2763008 RepID=UPI001642E53C|nr:SAM-dependent methyltransferase [Nocardioides sp. zg-1228]MBC2932751.1 SAM-dependent methyltransferase [Nocardioides sp. zg-1228]QSF58225.1 SAM-dependent methyltransferase [Nocardioides sp. zg-1228]
MSDELATVRAAILDADGLVRALASGRRKGRPAPVVGGREVRRVEVRAVDLKAGRHLQVTSYDDTQAHATNHRVGEAAEAAVDALLAEPFAHWHVDTATATHQLRVTKKGVPLLHTASRSEAVAPSRDHDRPKDRLLPEDHPVLVALGISDSQGRIKPTRQAKYRQVEELVRLLDASLTEAIAQGHVRTPTPDDPLRVVDLGCGNAYLTFAAHAYLADRLPVRMTGVDVKQQSADHNSRVAAELGIEADFVVGSIAEARLPRPPDVVLALHACDTATDDALARAVEWQAPLVLAAPCCHHDIAAQLRATEPPAPYAMLTRHGILRERFADTLTDALRASLLRREGYRVDVVEFVESAHTPRNTLLRAVRTGADGTEAAREYDELLAAWGVRPRLGDLLDPRPVDA